MSTFHAQQQSLRHLILRRMKDKPLVENAILSHTETNELTYSFIFR